MVEIKVFLSFRFDRDKELYSSFFAQAKDESCHAICNYSLDEKHPPEDDSWKEEAENKINQCDIVIVVVGKETHNAPGVKEEVKIAKRLGKPIFQIQPQQQDYRGVDDAGEIIPWKWEKINEKINKLLRLK